MKKILLTIAAIGALASCEREIDIIDPAALDDRNIYIRAYKYFDGNIADTNTLYQINGDFIKLSHAYITLSGAEFVSYDEQDTTRTATSSFKIFMDQPSEMIWCIPIAKKCSS